MEVGLPASIATENIKRPVASQCPDARWLCACWPGGSAVGGTRNPPSDQRSSAVAFGTTGWAKVYDTWGVHLVLRSCSVRNRDNAQRENWVFSIAGTRCRKRDVLCFQFTVVFPSRPSGGSTPTQFSSRPFHRSPLTSASGRWRACRARCSSISPAVPVPTARNVSPPHPRCRR